MNHLTKLNRLADEISDSWGFVGDADLSMIVRNFVLYYFSDNDERRDFHLREIDHHIDRINHRTNQSKELEMLVKKFAKMRTVTTRSPVNLQWLTIEGQETHLTFNDVVDKLGLTGKDKEFMSYIHYRRLDFKNAAIVIGEMVEQVSYNGDSEL